MIGQNIPPLTSIRAFAAWWVALYHFRDFFPPALRGTFTAAVAYGYLAVDLFFILSGFIIYLNYHHMFETITLKSLKAFAIARLSRIYPLHLFTTLIYAIDIPLILYFSQARDLGERYEFGYFILNVLLVHNWGFTDALDWNVPSWSISVEAGAYILFPIAALLTTRYVTKGAAAMSLQLLLLIAIPVVFTAAGETTIGGDIPRLGLIRCVLEFLIGVMTCRAFLLRGGPGQATQAVLLALSAGLIALHAGGVAPDHVVMPTAFMLLIFALTRPSGWVTKVMSHPCLVFLGDVSYATYMCHMLVRRLVTGLLVHAGQPGWGPVAVYVCLILICSALLYRWVERPALDYVRNRSRPPLQLAAVSSPVPPRSP